eukprot:m.48262 g.48262  ORF g.48262 m.48262 type:complete len:127 (+) comp12713_c0_seq1:255-635(+)
MAARLTATVRAATRAPRPRAAILNVTERAADRVRELLNVNNAKALRIGVRTRGCSGNAFTLDFVQEKAPTDEEVKAHGVTLYVDGKSILKILNSTMDFVETDVSSEFVFENPQAKGQCGCGESFIT